MGKKQQQVQEEKAKYGGISKKLSKDEKDKLISKLVKNAFKVKHEAIKLELIKLNDSVYDSIYTPEVLDAVAKLPSFITVRRSVIDIRYNSSKLPWDLRNYKNREMSQKKIMVDCSHPDITEKEYPEFITTAEKIGQKLNKIYEEEESTKVTTRSAIYSINTTKQLYEIWPEAFEVYCELFPNISISQYLPEIPRESLNKLLGLPAA